VATVSSGGAIRPIEFWQTKYGVPLGIDAAAVESLRGFIQTREPHVLAFTEVMFVTEGRGTLAVDDGEHGVAPGVVLVTRPGEVRQWRLDVSLAGACVFFEDERAPPRGARHEGGERVSLHRPAFVRGVEILSEMARELGASTAPCAASLQARLGRLARLVRTAEAPREWAAVPLVRAFQAAVEHRFRELPCVVDYAALLGVTPEHLSRAVTRHVGVAPSAVIHRRLLLEAKRRLRFTREPVHAIASHLGFEYPSYFVRFFKRGAGTTPGAYRRRAA